MLAELYNIANDTRSRHSTQYKWNGAPAIETGIGRDVRGPVSFAEAREMDLNDVRVPDSTMMDGPTYGQCHMWATGCKIDHKRADGVIRAR
jgi:hypothetical protein